VWVTSSYNLKCPVARTLDIIGERWTIMILRDLFVDGPRKFQDFEQSLKGISGTTLSARLKKLEEHGIVARRFYAEHPPRAEYVLTDKGRTLGPLLKMLLGWGMRHTR
jgi:DNA-binding HxlR family transcriptional regulator